MAKYSTNNAQETEKLGYDLAKKMTEGHLILFSGGLGAGKTSFCKGVARGLGYTGHVTSPTFSIANVYEGNLTFAHFDLYRINDVEDLECAGFYDYLDGGAVVAAEWSENAPFIQKDDKTIFVSIEILGDDKRIITIEGGGII